jgi:hypothetical protein
MAASVEFALLRTRLCPKKKAGRFPMREREGPTKNPIQRRQRNAQQKRRHNAPAGISNSESKEKTKLGRGFTLF